MTCHHARQQLAAYRRDDWTADEMRALVDHLAGCAECRQVEAGYRRVGESLRLLPTIIPDAAFRDRVFAAIAADQQKLGPAAILAARAETAPSLPVVRAPVIPISRRRAPQPVTRAALAVAAMLALALFASQFLPVFGSGGGGENFFHGFERITSGSGTLTPGLFAPSGQMPFSDAQFRATNAYRGWVGSDWLYVYAGESWTNAAAGQGRGALRIYDSHQTLQGVYLSPTPTRWLRITGVHGDKLTIQSDTGQTFTFDLTTSSFSA